MKIAFVIEYFFPFDKGGSQWSTYYLAKQLVEKGHDITIITPNFGSKEFEIVHGIKILRYPFYKKTKNFEYVPGHFFFTNPLFMIWSTFFLFFYIKKEKPQIIHIHGKYSIAPTRLADLFLKIPVLATIRDYIVICNYGICLMHGVKACNILNYYRQDFRQYFKVYVVNKTPLTFLINVMASIWGRVSTQILKVLSKGMNVVVLSDIQKEIFLKNRFKNVSVIANSFEFLPKKVFKKQRIITFAGRLTPGKGAKLILDIIPDLAKLYSAYTLYFMGEGFLKKDIAKMAKKYPFVKVLGNISHVQLLSLFSKSKIVLAPAVWPEPFGRVVMESLSCKTPVVVSRRSGLARLVNSFQIGSVCNPTTKSLLDAIQLAIKKHKLYSKNLNKRYPQLTKKFAQEPPEAYLKLYKKLI